MTAVWEAGRTLNNRYIVQQFMLQDRSERIYGVEDQAAGGENCLLSEWIAPTTEIATNLGRQLQPTINRWQAIKHPQIQQIKDLCWQQERLWLVQSDVDGQSYQQEERKPVSDSQVLQILQQMLAALSYLHNQQLYHGDICPANLQQRRFNQQPVLTNCQIAAQIREQLGLSSKQGIWLKLGSLVPNELVPLGAKGDLYALAATAAVLLTGQPVEVLFNPATQMWEWEQWKLASDQLTEVLNRMLAPSVEMRFATAEAALAELVVAPAIPAILYGTTSSNAPIPLVGRDTIVEPAPIPAFGLNDWQKAVITGGTIGTFVLLAIVAFRSPLFFNQSSQNKSEKPGNLAPKSTVTPALTQPSPTKKSPSPQLYRAINIDSKEVLLIYSAPGNSSQAIGCIPPNGTNIEASGERAKAGNDDWLLIKYKNPRDPREVRGWVNQNFIANQPSYYQNSAVSSSQNLFAPSLYKVVNVDNNDVLVVHPEPGFATIAIGCLPPDGRDIESTTDGAITIGRSLWVKIKYGELTGWVNSKYLTRQ